MPSARPWSSSSAARSVPWRDSWGSPFRACGTLVERTICYPSRAVGLILDLAVAALALAVIGSLGLLAWTLAVSGVRAMHRGRQQISVLRQTAEDGEARIQRAAVRASAA